MPRTPRLNCRFFCRNGFGGNATRRTPISAFSFQLSAFQLLPPEPSTAAMQEGLLREFTRKGDAFHDVVMMALPRKEWPPAKKSDWPGASIAAQKALP